MIFTWQKHYRLNQYYFSNYKMILELKSLHIWADKLKIFRFHVLLLLHVLSSKLTCYTDLYHWRSVLSNLIPSLTVIESTLLRADVCKAVILTRSNWWRLISSLLIPGVGLCWWVGITAAGQSHWIPLHWFSRRMDWCQSVSWAICQKHFISDYHLWFLSTQKAEQTTQSFARWNTFS